MMYEWDESEWWRHEFAAGSAGSCSDDEIEQMVEWSLVISHYQSVEEEMEFDEEMMAMPFNPSVNVRHERNLLYLH